MTETLIVGGGCFWCIEAVFVRLEGVQTARSGYMGGHQANPSYRDVCSGNTGHAEVVAVEFNPEVLPVSALLDVFFAVHDPTTPNRQGNDVGSQYRSVVFAANPAQAAAAREAMARWESSHPGQKVVTQLVEEPHVFYPAEREHWDYYDRNPYQGYCMFVVAPKVEKSQAQFPRLQRSAPAGG